MVGLPVELILIRQWASYISTAVWLIGDAGDLLYYNTAAEPLIGRPFNEQGEIRAADLADLFSTSTPEGRPLNAEELPIVAALEQRQPTHGRLRFRSLDGEEREIEITALPLDGQDGAPLGAVAFFWEATAS